MEPGILDHAAMLQPILWGLVTILATLVLGMVIWGVKRFHHRLCVLECSQRGLGMAFYELCLVLNTALALGVDCQKIKNYVTGEAEDGG